MNFDSFEQDELENNLRSNYYKNNIKYDKSTEYNSTSLEHLKEILNDTDDRDKQLETIYESNDSSNLQRQDIIKVQENLMRLQQDLPNPSYDSPVRQQAYLDNNVSAMSEDQKQLLCNILGNNNLFTESMDEDSMSYQTNFADLHYKPDMNDIQELDNESESHSRGSDMLLIHKSKKVEDIFKNKYQEKSFTKMDKRVSISNKKGMEK